MVTDYIVPGAFQGLGPGTPVRAEDGTSIGVVLSAEERPGGLYFTFKVDVDAFDLTLTARGLRYGGKATVQFGPEHEAAVLPPERHARRG
jgi:hypothetical protein